jgi:hypothetical protein
MNMNLGDDRLLKFFAALTVIGSLLALTGCGPTPRVDQAPRGSSVYPIRYDYNADGEIWFKNSGIQLRFDRDMYCRVFLRKNEKLYSINDIPPYEEKAKPPDFPLIQGKEIKNFLVDYQDIGASEMKTQLGISKRLNLTGYAKTEGGISLRKILKIDFYQEFPEVALLSVSYKNLDPQRAVFITRFYSGFYRMDAARGQAGAPGYLFQSMFGAAARVQSLTESFSLKEEVTGAQADGQRPLLDLWCNLMGMAVGVFPDEKQPATLILRVAPDKRVEMGFGLNFEKELGPGETYALPRAFLMVHGGDYATAWKQYSQLWEKLSANQH